MALYAYGFLIGIALTVIFWFLFVAPMERRMHQRKLDLMKRKLERNEERLRKLKENEQVEYSDDNENSGF
jgi:hypothetical protein